LIALIIFYTLCNYADSSDGGH